MSVSTPISQLRSAAMAALVAMLIWVFAEGESISSRTVMATVNFPTEPTGDVLIRAQDPNFRGSASVRLEGTTRTIDNAAAFVGSRIRLIPGSSGVPSTPGKGAVDLREAISNMPELRGLGSTVASVEPKQVMVEVIKLVSREVPVRVEFPPDLALEGEAVASPANITVRVPEAELGRLGEGAFAVAFLDSFDLRRLRSESTVSIQVLVRAPESLAGVVPLIVTPEQVAVSVRMQRRVETLKIPTVPVWFSLPPTEDAGKWVVELQDKFLTDVTLTGPVEELAKVRTGQITMRAMIELSTDDLEKGVTSKPAIFPGLPPGVTAAANLVRLTRIVRSDSDKPKP